MRFINLFSRRTVCKWSFQRGNSDLKKERSGYSRSGCTFLHILASLWLTHTPKWSWKKTWTPYWCSFSTSWCGCTPQSPSCLPTSSDGGPDLTGTSMAQRRSEPRKLRLDPSWAVQKDPTEPWVLQRGLLHHCTQEWTLWIRCLSTLPWGSPTETASVQERW